jgi:hypothetical protein
MGNVTVKMFGSLHTFRKNANLPSEAEVSIAKDGMEAKELALSMELPLDKIEGVVCNHTVYPLTHIIFPGDKVAFVSTGIPGPHRFTLGLYNAGKG